MTDTSTEAVALLISAPDYSCGDSESAKSDMLRAITAERDEALADLSAAQGQIADAQTAIADRDALQAKLDEAAMALEYYGDLEGSNGYRARRALASIKGDRA